MNNKEYKIAVDMWSRDFRNIERDLCEYGIELLRKDNVDLVETQKILDENYDIWTENMKRYFQEGYKFTM